jgi:streptogrisin C
VSGQGGIFGWGVDFGPVLESWFPGYDDALIRNDYPQWIQGPFVDVSPSNGRTIQVSGITDLLPGMPVCKSGITTLWTCGTVQRTGETVQYPEGAVYGLTRHNACVERGDSGGPNVSVPGVSKAAGVTSGASLLWDGSRDRCRSAFGLDNVSWYYPASSSLGYYTPAWNVSLW